MRRTIFLAAFLAAAHVVAFAQAAPPTTVITTVTTTQKVSSMSKRATGTFEVKLAAQSPHFADSALGRMSIDKQFHGVLEAVSKGEMLSAMSDVKGSAGYVAMERVAGALDGKRGTFVLQHTGTMNRDAPSLSVTVVPDSGTDELKVLTAKMNIIIADGKHSYEFDYSIAD